ncbi:hypothetical protein DAEQUDRAFT_762693 [Daedalea quercina L-15889]|uniref:Uncharacterized protein n=1 Tax=Daedalea quercina L-15889 TaxID=1314783 RepID=A0A165T3S1_9APHY|nr:hypothetical protein DAEQUDRAFT_762693 [Daedalea quercina L-15889]
MPLACLIRTSGARSSYITLRVWFVQSSQRLRPTPSHTTPFTTFHDYFQSPTTTTMGTVVSAIAGAIEAVISAIASIIMIIVSVIATIIVTIFDIIFDIICCNWCGGRSARTGTHRYRFGGGMGSSY